MKKGPIIVIGFKGCGKTTIGRKVASRLGVEFVDTDQSIEKLHKERMSQELGFREIYSRHGRDYFLTLEAEAVRSALGTLDRVVSLGGGALSTVETAGVNVDSALFVYITVERDTLFKRIMKGGAPAFFDKENPRESFDKFFDERAPLYESHAQIIVDNSGRRRIIGSLQCDKLAKGAGRFFMIRNRK